jgi:hypothetical protein
MSVLREIDIPEFGSPTAPPSIPASIYDRRCREAYARGLCDWLVVYGDREHNANLAFLTGYDPRFEEALLLLGPAGRRILVVGNEGLSYAQLASVPGLELALAQTVSLMGQDRSVRPSLGDVLREAGVRAGATIGLVGWKYLEAAEGADSEAGFFVPHAFVMLLERIAGEGALSDATPILMHPASGLRAKVDADQVALHEWGAARASAAVWRMIGATRPGASELEAASAMGYAGEILTAHVMFATADRDGEVVGLRSPGGRILKTGDGAAAAIGYWGGLSARAGLIDEHEEDFLKLASAYFAGVAAWYATAEIGITGGKIFDAVTEALARGGLRSALNPGHLTGHDEWIHTPIRPGSTERVESGMPFQVDVIPTPMPRGTALNCEDGVVLADAALRGQLRASHPEVLARMEARAAFVSDKIGVTVKDSILLLSSTPLCLAPFWLRPRRLLAWN